MMNRASVFVFDLYTPMLPYIGLYKEAAVNIHVSMCSNVSVVQSHMHII